MCRGGVKGGLNSIPAWECPALSGLGSRGIVGGVDEGRLGGDWEE